MFSYQPHFVVFDCICIHCGMFYDFYRTEQNRTEHILFPIKGPQGAYRVYMNKAKNIDLHRYIDTNNFLHTVTIQLLTHIHFNKFTNSIKDLIVFTV